MAKIKRKRDQKIGSNDFGDEEKSAPEPFVMPPGIWDQLDDETDRAYAAFCVFRNLAPHIRSVEESRRMCGKSDGSQKNFYYWSNTYHWLDRVRAWDAWWDRYAIQQKRVEVDKMVAAHAVMAEAMRKSVEARLEDVLQLPSLIRVQDLPRFAEVAVKIERLSRGVPETVSEVQQNVSPSSTSGATSLNDKISDSLEKLQQINELLAGK